MNLRLVSAAAAAALLIAAPAHAATVFAQDFSKGLGTNEQVSGKFGVFNGKVGHNGYPNHDYSYYQLSLDLTGVTDALLTFDYEIASEARYDAFNVLASTDGLFTWQNNLITPITAGFYAALGNNQSKVGPVGLSGQKAGTVQFDLSQFAGLSLDLRFQFQSDFFATGKGVQLDNLLVTGTPVPGVGAVPEPATWAMMILGFYGAGSVLRRRRLAEASV